MKLEDTELVEKYYVDNFNKCVEELEKQFIQDVEQHMIDNKARLDKKKKGGGKKAGKK
jgi:superoxide dismutase